MSGLEVRIERLPAMRMAYLSFKGENPEGKALEVLLDWAKGQGLLEGGDYRIFGYDNCEPHPNHIYTSWLTVGTEAKAEGDIQIKDFPGGLYAVTTVKGVENITPTWRRLAAWCESSQYEHGCQQSLEEVLTLGVSESELRLDLYLSLAE